MMGLFIALLAVGFAIIAVGIVTGVVWLWVVGFVLFVVFLVTGATLTTR